MRRCWLVCLVMMAALTDGVGQIAEDFGDGELHNNPTWKGDTGSFAVNYLKELQLAALQEGEVGLSTGNVLIDSTEWLFRISLGFSPSSNNYARVYLVADTGDLKGLVNGYYLQFGEAGSQDALTLFRQEGVVHTEVCRGESGAVAQAFNLRIRVTRSSAGQWEIYLRNEWESSFRHQATGTDALIATTHYFGLLCRFTSSNKQNFWFDDVYVQHIYRDLEPPYLKGVRISSDRSILLLANEPLQGEQGLQTENYILFPGQSEPAAVSWSGTDKQSIELFFDEAFSNPGFYQIQILNWCDGDSNCSGILVDSFHYFKARRWDIIFSEILVDPDPAPFNLPALEYIELYNRTPFPVPLGGWKLMIGNTSLALKADTLRGFGYALLTPLAANWGSDFLIQIIKGLSLPNTGSSLSLWDGEGNPIAFLDYTEEWYNDPFKKEGGWSLEMLDFDNPCMMTGNWRPSQDPGGGTPGRSNSINEVTQDLSLPYIANVYIIDTHTIGIQFSEAMDPASSTILENYLLIPGNISPLSLNAAQPACKEIQISFSKEFHVDSLYQLLIQAGLRDCSGNVIIQDSLRFGYSYRAEKGDLLITEILFNPWPGGDDFVEIYNHSNRVVDLSTLRLCTIDPSTGGVKSISIITSKPYSILPGEYRVFCPNKQAVLSFYPQAKSRAFLPDISSFPGYSDDKGGVGIALYTGELLDAFQYDKSMHSGFLKDVEGVSLERIHLDQPTGMGSNWHSASEAAGFATPGYKNSHCQENLVSIADFTLEPKEVSPDNDGWNDYLRVVIRPELPGYMANVWVFNSSGRMVKTLCRGMTLSEETLLIWDGKDENHGVSPNGLYILYGEVLGEDGRNKRHKEVFYLVRE